MLGRLSLTARLTALYTLVSACVLVGLGLLVSIAVGRHFVELDRDFLKDKIELVQTIVSETASSEMLAPRLDELLTSHHGLFIELRGSTGLVYGEASSVFSRLPSSIGTDGHAFDWIAGDQTLDQLSADEGGRVGVVGQPVERGLQAGVRVGLVLGCHGDAEKLLGLG